MKRIDSVGATLTNEWTEGDASTPATVLSADFMNIVQEEIAYVIESASVSLDQANDYEGSPAHNTTQLKQALDVHYVNASGDTMGGALTLSGAPTQNLHAATKEYADEKLAKSGDSMSGTLDMNTNAITNVTLMTLLADPSTSTQAARKGYVDAEILGAKAYADSLAGSSSNAVNSYSTNTTLTSSNSVVLVNASSAQVTITLPAPASGKVFFIKKTDSSANAVVISPPSGTIDGAASKSLSAQYDALTVVSDGTNFFII